MAISLRMSAEMQARLQELAEKHGKTKTALILEALEEKYHLKKSRRELIRETAGWMSSEEGVQLRETTAEFDRVDDADWP